MNTTKKLIAGLGAGLIVLSASVAIPAFAQAPKNISDVVTTADQAIAARISVLTDLNTKVQAMNNVSATEKINTSTEVQTNIDGLTALKAKINADTDISTARTDAQSVFGSFRIYALVVPQGYLLVSADRINTIGVLMNALSTKLTVRVVQGALAGLNLAQAQKTIADIGLKTKDADDKAALAANAIENLVPDQGNQTVASSNTGTLVAARANIRIATADLKAARQDIQAIIDALKPLSSVPTPTKTTQ